MEACGAFLLTERSREYVGVLSDNKPTYSMERFVAEAVFFVVPLLNRSVLICRSGPKEKY